MPQILLVDGVFYICVRSRVGAEDLFDPVENVLDHLAPIPGASLDDGNEVVQVETYICCGGGAVLRWEVFPDGISLGLRRA